MNLPDDVVDKVREVLLDAYGPEEIDTWMADFMQNPGEFMLRKAEIVESETKYMTREKGFEYAAYSAQNATIIRRLIEVLLGKESSPWLGKRDEEQSWDEFTRGKERGSE